MVMVGARMAGGLRQKVTIQQESNTDDGQGGSTKGWSAFASSVDCRLEPLRGDERLQAGTLEPRITHRATIRYRSGVTAGMRLLLGSTAYNIRAVTNPDERQRYLVMDVEEGVAT